MSSAAQSARKAELRAHAREIRACDRTSASERVIRRLVELPAFVRARTVAFYSAIGDEVPVEIAAAATRARGARSVYPVRTETGLVMALVDGGDSLLLYRDGIREPRSDSVLVSASEIDAFVVPGLMFDRAGRRLGRGGGHYDRYLERRRTDATIIGVCFVEHLVDELPEDSWDVVMDLIVTDEIVVWCSRHGADQ